MEDYAYHDDFRQFTPTPPPKVLRRIVLEEHIKARLVDRTDIVIAVEVQECTPYLLTVCIAWYIVGATQSMRIMRSNDDFDLALRNAMYSRKCIVELVK